MTDLHVPTLEETIEMVKRKFESAQAGEEYDITRVRQALENLQRGRASSKIFGLWNSMGDKKPMPDLHHLAFELFNAVEKVQELIVSPKPKFLAPPAEKVVEKIVELPVKPQILPEWPKDADDEPFQPRFEAIWHSIHHDGLHLLMVGGRPVSSKVNWVRALFGIEADDKPDSPPVAWLPTDGEHDNRAFNSAVSRMRGKSVSCVLYFPEFSGHVSTDILISGAREHRVPCAAAGRAGQQSILDALAICEKQIGAK